MINIKKNVLPIDRIGIQSHMIFNIYVHDNLINLDKYLLV